MVQASTIDEKSAFETGNASGELSGAKWQYIVDLGQDSDAVHNCIVSVFKPIIFSSGEWPSDEAWQVKLPISFQRHFPCLTKEQSDELLAVTPRERWSELPWEFGSWLDAIKVRGWKWVRHERSGNRLVITLAIVEWPAHLEAFEQGLKACGGIVIEDKDISS